MKNALATGHRPADFEEFGYRTMLECNDVERATKICGLHLCAYEVELRHELQRRNSEIAQVKHQAGALHGSLYDRPEPVNDPQMLSHRVKARILLCFAALAGVACLVGNMTTFYLLGFGSPLTIISGAGLTALPLVVGHLAYEWIISASRWLQVTVVVVAVALAGCGILMIGQARSDMVDRAVANPSADSYVDGLDTVKDQPPLKQKQDETSERGIHRSLGEGMFLVMLAVDLALAFLVGFLVRMYTDDDFTAWKKLKRLAELVIALEERVSELMALPEVAKKRCLAGILRAENARTKRHPPYHRALTMLLIVAFCSTIPCRAQTVDRYEGILIDTSASISRSGRTNGLFHQYLIGTKKLLLTEPSNSRIWVSAISIDSFGGTREILTGRTPKSSGVFTDDLNRGRRQLASAFELKSSRMAAVVSGTDIFGGLWRMKVLFDSGSSPSSARSVSKTIWIFSDMINETKDFPVPKLLEIGPERMLERAKASGLVVPLPRYEIRIYGASTAGLTPRSWATIRRFWEMYFEAAGATLMSYSTECDAQRAGE